MRVGTGDMLTDVAKPVCGRDLKEFCIFFTKRESKMRKGKEETLLEQGALFCPPISLNGIQYLW